MLDMIRTHRQFPVKMLDMIRVHHQFPVKMPNISSPVDHFTILPLEVS